MAFPALSVPNIHFFQEKSVAAQHFLQDRDIAQVNVLEWMGQKFY
jgi:hypothetical protein